MPATPFSHRPARAWLQISIDTPVNMTDSISGFLAELTESGVEISAPAVDAKEPAKRETITGYLADDEERSEKEQILNDFLQQITARFPGTAAPILTTSHIDEEDWGKNWKEHFKPIQITPRVTIKPSWEDYKNSADEIVIEMDPGMAFGTGHHASTRLALKFIDACFIADSPHPRTALDVGTGTGVLGMACALFGADKVLGIDNDPDAVAAAQENIARNNLGKKVTITGQDLTTVKEPFDLVIANITSNVLTEMAEQLFHCMAPGGQLILAGILTGEQEQSIQKTFTSLGLRHLATSYEDEWASLHFAKD